MCSGLRKQQLACSDLRAGGSCLFCGPPPSALDGPALTPPAHQVGRVEPVMVLRVDKEKGYIDLSKRCVAQRR
jgi:hypothetical protein